MSYLLRDRVAIYYEVHGAGPTILLTHGFASTGGSWSGQLDLLKKDHQVILWDMRGHGRTDSPSDPAAYSEALTTADMSALLDVVGADRAILGGHSLGGFMSMAFHAEHPERVEALLLCGTGPGYRKDEARAGWNVVANAMGDLIEKEGLSALRDLSVEMRAADHKSAQGLVFAARGMLIQSSPRVLESISSIAVPTLVAVGEHDEDYLSGTQYLASKIKGAEYVVFDGAAHAPQIDNRNEFNMVLHRFLARVSAKNGVASPEQP